MALSVDLTLDSYGGLYRGRQTPPYSLLFIGLGHQGREHFNAALALNDSRARIVGVCDSDSGTAVTAEAHGIRHFTDYREGLAVLQPQIAIVSVPNQLHIEVTEACLAQHVHVLKEKPLALTLAEGSALFAFADHHDCLLRVAQQRFHHPWFRRAAAWRSAIGRQTLASYEFTLNDTRRSWYWDDRCGGGSWYGLGWHASAVLNWFVGTPRTVAMRAFVSNRRPWMYTTDDTALVSLEFENGCFGRVLTSVAYPTKAETLQMHGSHGTIEVTRARAVLYDRNGAIVNVYDERVEPLEPYIAQLSSFIDAIERGDRGDDHALATMAIVQAGISSGSADGATLALNTLGEARVALATDNHPTLETAYE